MFERHSKEDQEILFFDLQQQKGEEITKLIEFMKPINLTLQPYPLWTKKKDTEVKQKEISDEEFSKFII